MLHPVIPVIVSLNCVQDKNKLFKAVMLCVGVCLWCFERCIKFITYACMLNVLLASMISTVFCYCVV